jgi:hypothetical protein
MTAQVDFTRILPIPANVYPFNPSIAHWRDNEYLCSFREFVRYPHLFQKGASGGVAYDYSINTEQDPNHPWLGGGNCRDLFWQWGVGGGFDNTKMVVLRIEANTGRMTVINSITIDISHNIIQNISGQDARLLKLDANRFLLSYNDWKHDQIIKNGLDCRTLRNGCYLIYTRIITLLPSANASDPVTIHMGQDTVLCPNISNATEKNWSFSLLPGNNVRFSYGLSPTHDMFTVNATGTTVECVAYTQSGDANNIFNRLSHYYNMLSGRHTFHVSVTTPTVQITDQNHIYTGVGHIKYEYKDMGIYPAGSPLLAFHNQMIALGKTFHTTYVYLMFLYSFDMNNGNIVSCSPMFIPPSTGTLCFPSGLTFNNTTREVILSYGDNDDKCRILLFSLDKLYEFLNKDNYAHSPAEDVSFLMLGST